MRNLARYVSLAIQGFAFEAAPAFAEETYLDPDYIGCMIAVDDADIMFRQALQSTCVSRMADLCDSRDEDATGKRTVECLNRESRQALRFVASVTEALPRTIEGQDYRAASYRRRHMDITQTLAELRQEPRPEELPEATLRIVRVASAVHMVFLLARDSGTDLDRFVPAASGE
ncbi:hypothetical protein [uncultured Jannaschia sp.]|uniref:hypothetical protein n=1 Tax=uncultured Jannaschia sp. TaxID=293347 RepID=UPI00262168E3|nr:hypothetical protein [uncultured Jannaschia sp.]